MTSGEVSLQYGLMWWLDVDPHGHPAWLAQGWAGQLIAVVPEHELVVAVGSVATAEMDLAGYNMWLWVNDVIMPALG
jgi:CubicO group peptidase (beta-lactamase class C family)